MNIVGIVACSLTLSFGAAVGVNLQKLSMNRERRRSAVRSRSTSSRSCQEEEEEEDLETVREAGGDTGEVESGESSSEVMGEILLVVDSKPRRRLQRVDDIHDHSSNEATSEEKCGTWNDHDDSEALPRPSSPREITILEGRDDDSQQQSDSDSGPEPEPEPTSAAAKPRPPFKQPLWCLGMTIIVLDAVGDFVFIGLAPQSLLAPLGSLSLGWNVILAPIFHPQEIVTHKILLATAVIYIGTILTVLFASETSATHDLQDIIAFAQNRVFLLYMTLCLIFQFAVVLHGHSYRYSILHYCSLAGCFGGQCILFAKSASELVKNLVLHHGIEDWTTSIMPYIFLLGMTTCLLLQISFLNTGLDKFDALIVVPLYQSFWNIFAITGGLIFFQEHQYMSQTDDIMYAIGIGITLVGIRLFILWRRKDHDLSQYSVGRGNEVEMLLSSDNQTSLLPS